MKDYNPDDETVMKPIGDITKLIAATSPGDLLLFMIALELAEREKKSLDID